VPQRNAREQAAGEFVRETLRGYVERFIEQERALDRGARDPEIVHQARVAIRRLRSVLRTFSPLLEAGWAQERRARLRQLSDELSATRDADIMLQRARKALLKSAYNTMASTDALLSRLIASRDDAYARLAEIRGERQHASILREIAALPEQVVVLEPDVQARAVAPMLLANAWRRVRKRVRRAGKHPSDPDLHRIRMAAKHLRYALEAFATVLGRKALRVARRVEKLQDVLGREHDAAVLAQLMRSEGLPPEAAIAARGVALHEEKAACKARRRWRGSWRELRKCWKLHEELSRS
jgi:CHAD domain-containing protein